MSVLAHHVLAVPQRGHAEAAEAIAASVSRYEGARLYGIWKPLIGLSLNHLVVLTGWPDTMTALGGAGTVVPRLPGVGIVQQDLWTPTLRPAPGAPLPRFEGGYYSHRHYDIEEDGLQSFLEHSGAAWGNFEGTHASSVIGLWRSSHVPAPGLIRMRLMAWYRDMGVWEASRYWKGTRGAETANQRLGARYGMTIDSAVSIVELVRAV